jgi:hypothetical protein
MDVSWQDSVASFTDLSGTDPRSFASFVSGDGDTLWSSSGDTPFSGQSVLWESRADTPNDSHISGLTPDAFTPDSSPWLAEGWMGNGSLPFSAGTIPSDVGSLVWQATLFRFEEVSAIANSSTLDSTLNQILDVVWTATGGTGSPPVILPHAPTNPFLGGSPLVSLPSSQVVWTGQPREWFPGGTGLPPVTSDFLQPTGSLAGRTFPTLGAENVAWTDPSAATGLLAGPSLGGAALTTLASSLGGRVQDTTGMPTSLGISR